MINKIIFSILVLTLGFGVFAIVDTAIKKQDIDYVELPDFKIPSEEFKNLADIVPNNAQFVMCSIEDDKCFWMYKDKLGAING